MKTRLLLLLAFLSFYFTLANNSIVTVPILPNIPPLTYCDTNNDGFGAFDLTTVTPVILAAQSNGPSAYQISYHETFSMASSGSNPITDVYYNITAWNQQMYYRIIEIASGDAAIGSFYLQVNPRPVVTIVNDIALCDDDNNGTQVFNLTVVIPQIAAVVSPMAVTVTFYNSMADASAGVSPIVPATAYHGTNGETIWARVENNAGCYTVVSFGLIVNSLPFASGPQIYSSCDTFGDPFDGQAVVNLTTFAPSILNGQNPATHQIKYFATMADAIADTNQISLASAQNYVTFSTDIWVKVINTSGCYSLTTIHINIAETPNPIITSTDNRSAICVAYPSDLVVSSLTLDSNMANPSAYSFEWYEATSPNIVIATSPTYTINTAAIGGASRSYSVVVQMNNSLGCSSTSSMFNVIQSGPASITQSVPNGYTITNLSGVQSITVLIIGYGTYEYSLDNGPHQSSNVFNNVSLGQHTITVWDTEGGLNYSCDPLVITEVQIEASQVPAPTGLNPQTFAPGSTLANIVVSGTNIQWYASASNKINTVAFSTPLPSNTVLVDGMTYYATQTVGGVESTAYLPVTVHLSLSIGENEIFPVRYGPNPVKNIITLQSIETMKSVSVFTMLGQKVVELLCNDTNFKIDLSNLTTGNYVLKVQGETGQKTIRLIKE